MSTQVAITEPPKPQLVAGGKLSAIIPQTMDEAYRMAKAVCMAGMAPKGMDTPEKAMIAIMRGMEVGLTPFQALDKIAVVNGRPTIWGDGAMALVRGSGICEWIRETIEDEGDKMVAVCRAKRRGEVEPIIGTFSVADAKKAGLWGKAGPWQQFPKRMLQMRARAFCLRVGFADVLGGLYLREEIEDASTRSTPPAPTATPAQPRMKLPPPPPPVAADTFGQVTWDDESTDSTVAATVEQSTAAAAPIDDKGAGAADPPQAAPAPEKPKAKPPAPSPEERRKAILADLVRQGDEIAETGERALDEWIDNLTGDEQALLTPAQRSVWKQAAVRASA